MSAPFVENFGRLAAAAAIALWTTTVPTEAAGGPFSGLGGSWNGTGHVELSNGTKERIRCRASYEVSGDGHAMHQSLRCASDSYKFELRSDVESQGNQISGNWSELTRSVSGKLGGHARRGRIEVFVKSETFNATLTLVSNGNRQSVTIKSEGTQFSGATIKLARGG
jgi:hypothetical protein